MPYSTGGGSHSGGYSSSGSSSHSSGGSHSGGYSSSGSNSYNRSSSSRSRVRSVQSVRVSKHRFPDADRYVFYRDDKPQYLYSNYATRKREKHNGRLVFYIIFVAILILGCHENYSQSLKVEVPANLNILVEDSLGVLDHREELDQSMSAFLETSGIAPAVITLSNESWQAHYDNLTAKAFDLYVTRFRDEKHWLIVYSQPKDPDPAFLDWYWEGIAGDDTEGVLTDEIIDTFGKRLQRYLTDEKIGVGKAISLAFSDTAGALRSSHRSDRTDIRTSLIIILGFTLLGIWRSGYWPLLRRRPRGLPRDAVPDTGTRAYRRKKKAEQTVPAPEPAPISEEPVCEYCGAILPNGAIRCPNCGAARKKKN